MELCLYEGLLVIAELEERRIQKVKLSEGFKNKMKNSKTTKKKWEYEMKKKEPLQCWIVNIMSSRNPFYERWKRR